MKVQLISSRKNGNCYEFRVIFLNDSENSMQIPLQKMQRVASRVGLFISDGDFVLEPIAFDVVAYRDASKIHTLQPQSSAEIVMLGELRKAGASSHILVFDGATYKIDLEHSYEISFRLDDFKSNAILQVFSLVA